MGEIDEQAERTFKAVKIFCMVTVMMNTYY